MAFKPFNSKQIIMLLFLVLLTACSSIKPTLSPLSPTDTPNLPTPSVPMADKRYKVEGGGFSFEAPEGYRVTTKLYSASISSPDGMVTFRFFGMPNEYSKTLDDLRQNTVETVRWKAGEVESAEPIATTIDDERALIIDLTYLNMDSEKETVALATPNDGAQIFTGKIGAGSEARGDEVAIQNASPEAPVILTDHIFYAILSTVQFHAIPPELNLPILETVNCPISADDTYGLTRKKPIVIPYVNINESRVYDYLAVITGPEGQPIKAEWTNAVPPATNLFSVSYEGGAAPVIFYIKEIEPETYDDLQPPMVPNGFACTQTSTSGKIQSPNRKATPTMKTKPSSTPKSTTTPVSTITPEPTVIPTQEKISKIQTFPIEAENVAFKEADWSEIPFAFPEYSYIYDITTDPDGSMWFATSAGMLKYDGRQWKMYSVSSEAQLCSSVASNPKTGLVAAACVGRVFILKDGEKWEPMDSEPPGILQQVMFRGLNIQDDGSLWMGIMNPEMGYTPGLGVIHFNGQEWDIYYPVELPLEGLKTKQVDLPFTDVMKIVSGLDGKLWFETNVGITNYDGKTWRHYFFPDLTGKTFDQGENVSHKRSGLFGLVAASDGAIWVGSTEGAARFDGTAWSLYTLDSSPSNAAIMPMAAGTDGSVWFLSQGGLLRFDGSRWWSYPLPPEFQDPLSAAIGGNQELWMADYDKMIVRYMPGGTTVPTAIPVP